MLKLFIYTNDDAFQDEPATELARILRKLADQIEENPESYIILRDYNGNKVGECQITKES